MTIMKDFLNAEHSGRDEWHERELGTYHASSCGKCLRHRYYQHAEDPQPDKSAYPHFELGHRLESVFLDALKEEFGDRYVKTDIPIEIQFDGYRIVGETDPVVVGENGVPKEIFEVKTTTNLKYTRSEPKWTHLCQLHSYMKALDLEESSIVYIQKTDLSTQRHRVEFDPEIWETIDSSTRKLHEALLEKNPPDKQPEEGRDYFCSAEGSGFCCKE